LLEINAKEGKKENDVKDEDIPRFRGYLPKVTLE
jgi:hypothetical protein